MISAGEFVQASGTWVNDRTHGVQFRASLLKATAPTTTEGIERYLRSGMIRGIGPIYAKKLVRAFGEAMLFLHSNGVGTSRAVRIYKTYGADAVQLISENPYLRRICSRSRQNSSKRPSASSLKTAP
jgi:exodeoxyribonuclease V alpha subunit